MNEQGRQEIGRNDVSRIFALVIAIVSSFAGLWVLAIEPILSAHGLSAHDSVADLVLALVLTTITLVPAWILVHRLVSRINRNTERNYRLMREAEASDLAKSRFLAACSHHLRTPLNAVQGYAHLLAAAPPADASRVAEYSSNIVTGAERLHELVDKILTFSEVDTVSDDPTTQMNDVDLRCELEPLIDEIREKFSDSGIGVSLSVPGSANHAVNVEAMTIAAREAIENAFAHSHATSVSIEYDKTATGFSIIVADNGVGVPTGDDESLFSIFNVDQHDPHKSGTSKLGIGLALMKRAMVRAGGEAEIESWENRGTRVMLKFPGGAVSPLATSGTGTARDRRPRRFSPGTALKPRPAAAANPR